MSFRAALRRQALVPVAFVALLAAPGLAGAQEQAWDQEKVAAIASELAGVVNEADRLMRTRQLGDQNKRDFYRLRETVRRLRNESRRLSSLLENGEGHDETLSVYEQMGVHVRDAREIIARMFTVSPLAEQVRAARGLLDQLAVYYDARPLPPPLGRL